jgi:hypothetical protein
LQRNATLYLLVQRQALLTFTMPSVSSLLTALGSVLILHAAYSCLHYRSILQDLDLEESFQIPPADVYVEVGLAFVVLLVGELLGVGSLQPVEVTIKANQQKRRPMVAPNFKTRDFDIYANRSKML